MTAAPVPFMLLPHSHQAAIRAARAKDAASVEYLTRAGHWVRCTISKEPSPGRCYRLRVMGERNMGHMENDE